MQPTHAMLVYPVLFFCPLYCETYAGGCTRDTDVTACPDPLTFGLSYDDGPSPYTPLVLDYLAVEELKASFFVVGSRVISRPEMLQLEYVAGHQISVHTWSHPPLTTLTNEQIVAELGWTMKAIKDVTGVTPNTMRPPYGDIDDRVRAICTAMGLTPIVRFASLSTLLLFAVDTICCRYYLLLMRRERPY